MATSRTAKKPPTKRSTSKLTPEVQTEIRKMLGTLKGYEACHTWLYETKGIWIPELVPVFKKLDKMLEISKR
ncbi:hypothetical protein GGD66_003668 [Bradyrhizobium sp. CIR48]|uniref:hypothetical protein n=1 Tax=Bradyrhizobium sp. CIR48 TaxID=2663840 RepID=UPI0016069C01|nr:hypothetical protein [Bradyrhizobium sp. CIR48]MBB4425111.1 hypothetical protein [Bradyrhizobium sp. CIR48]